MIWFWSQSIFTYTILCVNIFKESCLRDLIYVFLRVYVEFNLLFSAFVSLFTFIYAHTYSHKLFHTHTESVGEHAQIYTPNCWSFTPPHPIECSIECSEYDLNRLITEIPYLHIQNQCINQ